MEKLVVVEGPDGAGKTTLSFELLKEFESLEYHRNHLGPEQKLDSWWIEILNDPCRHVIVDRFFYSELVYGPILRGEIAYPSVVPQVWAGLRDQAFVIYVRPSTLSIYEGIGANVQLEGVEKNLTRIIHSYDDLMTKEAPHLESRFFQYNRKDSVSRERLHSALQRYLYGEFQ